MQFECRFRRRHKTKTTELKLGQRAYEVSVAHAFRLEVEVSEDLTRPEARQAFIARAVALADRTHPDEAGEWEPTRFEGACEKQPVKPLPTPLLQEGSLAELLIRENAREYPTLYGADAYTRYKVFGQWFMTLGNGMGWRDDGVLVERGETGSVAQLRERALRLLDAPPTPEYLAQLEEEANSPRWSEPGPQPSVHLYPLSAPYCAIYGLPDTIEDSFLCAAVDACRYFLSRPVWECCTRAPHWLEGKSIAIYETDEWQALTLEDGLVYFKLVEEVYTSIVERFRPRLEALGWVEEAFERDMKSPPMMISKNQ